jgi:hypothetical protein
MHLEMIHWGRSTSAELHERSGLLVPRLMAMESLCLCDLPLNSQGVARNAT